MEQAEIKQNKAIQTSASIWTIFREQDTSSLQLKRSQPTQLMQMMQLSSLPKQELTLPKEQLKMQELIFNGKKEDTDKSIFKDR